MRKNLSLFTMLMLVTLLAFAQTRPITGRVIDEAGQPVSGASIVIRGTSSGASADANGDFRINAKTGDVLVITAVGIPSREVTVTSGSKITVSLTRQSQNLSEVIVTTALGVQRQARSLGYSTAKVSSGDLNEAKPTNIAAGLSAKVAGLQISAVNNGVNPDVRVTLRGARSFLGNNQALLVVDGNILPIRFLNSLNPNDVDNVTVLKGASASALYGSDASNGVIIVTTKKGRGATRITFSSTVNMESVAYMPKLQDRFGQNGGEYDTTLFPSSIYFPGDPFRPYSRYENQQFGPEFNGATIPIGFPTRFFRADGTFYDSIKTGKYSAAPNSKKNFFDKGITLQNDFSYSSGDENGSFYLSFQDVSAKGTVPKDVNHRNTFRINGSRTGSRLSAEYNISYAVTHTNTTPGTYVPFRWGTSDFNGNYTAGSSGTRATGGSYYQGRPVYWTIINTPANINLRDYRNWQTDPFASPSGYFNAYYGNPWWQIDQARLDEKMNDLIGSAALVFKATDWLSASYRFSYGRNDYANNYTKAGYNFADWAINVGNTYDGGNAGNIATTLKKVDPSAGTGVSMNQRITSDFLITAKHNFFKDFDATLLLGNQVTDRNFRTISHSANTLIIPDFYNVASNGSGTPSITEVYSHSRLYGVFADLTIGYKNYLFLHGSARNDKSSLLSVANRSFFYPSGDAAFVFTELTKNSGPSWLNYGKVRAAFSRVGQVSVDPYSLQSVFGVGNGFPYGATGGYSVGNAYANADLKPELTTEFEVGLDLGILKDKITFSAALYKQNTTDQTVPITISSSTGFTSAYVNSGEMQNKGVELDLRANILKTASGFRWDVGGNFAYNQSKVLSIGYGLTDVFLGNNSTTQNTFAVVGQPYGEIKASDWKRDPSGRIIVDKNTGYPSPASDLVYFGTTTPPYRLGLNTSISFKGFTLNVVADGRFGAIIYNDMGQDLDFTGSSWYSAQNGRQAFVIPNSVYFDGKNYIPNTNISVKEGNNQFWASTWNQQQSPYVNSADFWKIREVALSYQIPRSIVAKSRVLKTASVALIGRNLAMWKAKDNPWTDPEYSNTSSNAIGTTDINQTPPTRFYGATIQIGF